MDFPVDLCDFLEFGFEEVTTSVKRVKLEPLLRAKTIKEVLYNHLVDAYNNPESSHLVYPYRLMIGEKIKNGFKFESPEAMAEFYCLYCHNKSILKEEISTGLKQDLMHYYEKSLCSSLFGYFDRFSPLIYFYYDTPLFSENSTVDETIERIKTIERKWPSKKALEAKKKRKAKQ
jgi:hypothetical protein